MIAEMIHMILWGLVWFMIGYLAQTLRGGQHRDYRP